jgi:hypothetical protein
MTSRSFGIAVAIGSAIVCWLVPLLAFLPLYVAVLVSGNLHQPDSLTLVVGVVLQSILLGVIAARIHSSRTVGKVERANDA